jgi:hypothetical protein
VTTKQAQRSGLIGDAKAVAGQCWEVLRQGVGGREIDECPLSRRCVLRKPLDTDDARSYSESSFAHYIRTPERNCPDAAKIFFGGVSGVGGVRIGFTATLSRVRMYVCAYGRVREHRESDPANPAKTSQVLVVQTLNPAGLRAGLRFFGGVSDPAEAEAVVAQLRPCPQKSPSLHFRTSRRASS